MILSDCEKIILKNQELHNKMKGLVLDPIQGKLDIFESYVEVPELPSGDFNSKGGD